MVCCMNSLSNHPTLMPTFHQYRVGCERPQFHAIMSHEPDILFLVLHVSGFQRPINLTLSLSEATSSVQQHRPFAPGLPMAMAPRQVKQYRRRRQQPSMLQIQDNGGLFVPYYLALTDNSQRVISRHLKRILESLPKKGPFV